MGPDVARATIVLARRGVIAVGGALVILGNPACEPSSTAVGFTSRLKLPDGWNRVDREAWKAPGRRLTAWSGPLGSSLVVYRTVPDPHGSAEQTVESIANRLANLPGFTVVSRRVETVAGVPAARVEVVAPGTGTEIAPTGLGLPASGPDLVPTREITIGFPRPDGSLFLVWRMPESAHEKLAPAIESILASLTLPPRSSSDY